MNDNEQPTTTGSNNRNCERAETTQNQQRLFNSQNNNNGGYNCPRAQGGKAQVEDKMGDKRMYYYEGSILPIQWTNQHSCGRNNTQCTVIIQYACEDTAPGMRDGIPSTYNPNSADSTATETILDDPEKHKLEIYGQHETYEYYQKCKNRLRNSGLWIADRNIGSRAINTRQNNGQRHGFECPEERDYYPYWHPSPWKDIAVLTWNRTMCDYYKANSENVKGRGECQEDKDGKYSIYNNPIACNQEGGEWIERAPHGIDPPECIDNSMYNVRDNHLGSASPDGEMATYNWTIPTLPEGVESFERCVVRIRYNITTDEVSFDTDHRQNKEASPLKQDPVIDMGLGFPIELAVNTNQNPRTFQDRSYTFKIKKRPERVKLGETEVKLSPKARIYNVNVRGKRGNIVQTYPSLEYDFVPNWLSLRGGDWIHIQWTGSDYNPARAPNNAEGGPPFLNDANNANSGSDRSNFVQAISLGNLHPVPATNFTFFKVPPRGEIDMNLAKRLVFLDQNLDDTNENTRCKTTKELLAKNNNNEDNAQRDIQVSHHLLEQCRAL